MCFVFSFGFSKSHPSTQNGLTFNQAYFCDAKSLVDCYFTVAWIRTAQHLGLRAVYPPVWGVIFPLDVEAIEKHTKECEKTEHMQGELLGKCHACGALLPLNSEEIERHLSVCEKKKAPPGSQLFYNLKFIKFRFPSESRLAPPVS